MTTVDDQVIFFEGADTIVRNRIKMHPLFSDIMERIDVHINKTRKSHFIQMLELAGMEAPTKEECLRYKELSTIRDMKKIDAIRVINFEARERGDHLAVTDLPESSFMSFDNAKKEVMKVRDTEVRRSQKRRAKAAVADMSGLVTPPETAALVAPIKKVVATSVDVEQPVPVPETRDLEVVDMKLFEQAVYGALASPEVSQVQIIVSGENFRDEFTRFSKS